MRKISILLLAAATFQTSVWAQGNPSDPKVLAVLSGLPAKNISVFNSSMAAVGNMGESGLISLISGLAASGKADNSKIEYTIGGFSAYVTRPGNEGLRKMAVAAYSKALNKLSDKKNKQFIISQFDVIGDDDAIPALQAYLTDNDLADAAARALAKINTASSKAALLTALPQTTGAAKGFVIEALGDARYQPAATVINKIAANDAEFAKPALYALSYIAAPSSQPVLAAAAAKAGYKYEKTNATQAYLVYAEQLLKNGNKELAQKIATELSAKANGLANVRAGALKLLVEASKGNQAMLLTAAGDANAQYRAAALRYALPYVTPANLNLWTKKLTTVGNEARVDILYMLGQTNLKAALPAILAQAKGKDAAVKQAAIDAAVKIGQDKVLSDFLKMMATASPDDIDMLATAIGYMKGEGINQRIGAAIPSAPEKMQKALIDILDSRADNSQWPVIWSQIKSPHPGTKQAALGALAHVATKDNAPQLYSLLNESAAGSAEESAAQDALVFVFMGAGDGKVDMAQMSAASPQKKLLYYKVLASAGGAKNLKMVAEAYNTGGAQVKAAAFAALTNWNGGGANAELLRVARTANDEAVITSAIAAYRASLKLADDTPEEKLLKLREGFSLAKSTEQKQQLMKDIAAQAPCFNTLLFAAKYLDDATLARPAADAVVNSALAGVYNDDATKALIKKAIALANPKQKAAAEKYVAGMKGGAGFVSMFNGTDLTGWKGLVADPIKRAAMDEKTLAAAQEKADAEARQSWKPVNGELQFIGKGNNLATVKKYRDVEMYVDWKIIDDHKGEGDAGIYLRGSPQVQIWDLARTNVGAQVGSGGLYNNQVYPSKPLVVADNKLDEWNTFHIIMIGDRVTVYLNGQLVTDNVILENYWNRKIPIFAEEQIELQAHGSPVAYRDLYIREIPSEKPFELSKQEQKEGYKILFDGTNMFNWTGNTIDYALDSGTLAIHPRPGKGSGGNLYTKEEFSDFIFRFEFQLTPGANNGLGIRTPMEGDAAYVGMELQILDNEDPVYKSLHEYQYHGSVYGTIPAKRGYLKPVGQWNYEEVVVKGPKIKITLNGTVILDGDITEFKKNGTPDGKQHPGLQNDKGHIGFLGHGSVVRFKNIRIKDLAATK